MKKNIFWIAVALQAVYVIPNLIATGQYYWMDFSKDNASTPYFYLNITTSLSYLATFYWVYLVLFPKFLFLKRIKEFVIYSLLMLLVSFTISVIFLLFATRNLTWFTFDKYLDIGALINYSLNFLLAGVTACIARGFVNWINERSFREQLEKKNLETNLALLKAQINPHFLFNTLNNIDVLIEKDPSTASVYLKKLSDILRFTLYETPSETVSLQQEIEYISQYIDLQKIRTANPDFVKFETEGNLQSISVPPMLLIPFIENAFKHSTNKKLTNAIEIKINAQSNQITFICSNAYDVEIVTTQAGSGLGLELIKNRLELLYKNSYHLNINKTTDRFTVNLTIDL